MFIDDDGGQKHQRRCIFQEATISARHRTTSGKLTPLARRREFPDETHACGLRRRLHAGAAWPGEDQTACGGSTDSEFAAEAICVGREVLLCCREDPWVFARSVVPMATLQGRHRRIAHLGVRPLGDFLFSSSGLKRGKIRVLPLHADPPMHAACTEALGAGPVGAWLRQSLFQLDRAPLLISEVFLPQ